MPTTDTTTPEVTPEALAAALALLRSQGVEMATATVTAAAEARQAAPDAEALVALRVNLSPDATPEERREHILRCAAAAGILTPSPEGPEGYVRAEGFVAPSLLPTVDGPEGDRRRGILSVRRVEVLTAQAQGHSYGTGPEACHMSQGTYKSHLAIAYRALGVRSAPEAIVAAVRVGALPLALLLPGAPAQRVATEAEREAAQEAVQARRERRPVCSAQGCRKVARTAEGTCRDHAEG